jgi:hypothetical protein
MLNTCSSFPLAARNGANTLVALLPCQLSTVMIAAAAVLPHVKAAKHNTPRLDSKFLILNAYQ